MRSLQLALAVLLSVPAGGLALVGYLWYRYAPTLYAQWLFPDDRLRAGLLRCGVSVGCIALGGVLLAVGLAFGIGAVSRSGAVVSPQCRFQTAAAGLFAVAAVAFGSAAAGYLAGR